MKLRLVAFVAVAAMALPALGHAQKRGKKKNNNKSADSEHVVDSDSAAADDEKPTVRAKGEAKIIKRGKKGKEKLFDFTGLQLEGNLRMPQLLYFLDRANQELERASLERRTFIPEMVRTIDEEAL